jgi:hypothetical protein
MQIPAKQVTVMTNKRKHIGLALTFMAAGGCETVHVAPERGRQITWSGFEWAVKNEPKPVGPGPNRFSGSSRDIYVDDQGRLHLKIVKRGGYWMSTEMASFRSLGYGTYSFDVEPGATQIPGNAVLGLFTYDREPEDQHREIDFEVSRWGDGRAENLQCALQPAELAHLVHRVPLSENPAGWTMSFRWSPGLVDCTVATRGAPPQTVMTHRFSRGVPRPGNEKVRLNFWLYRGSPPDNGAPAEVVVSRFRFTPL